MLDDLFCKCSVYSLWCELLCKGQAEQITLNPHLNQNIYRRQNPEFQKVKVPQIQEKSGQAFSFLGFIHFKEGTAQKWLFWKAGLCDVTKGTVSVRLLTTATVTLPCEVALFSPIGSLCCCCSCV